MNVVMLSSVDYAGSGWRLVDAIRKKTDINILQIVRNKHRFGFPVDVVLTNTNRFRITQLIQHADILHFKGSDLPSSHFYGIHLPKHAKRIITVAGSGFRRLHPQLKRSDDLALGWYSIEDYVKATDFRTTFCADLNYPEFDATFVPFPIDSENAPYCWKEPKEEFVIGYYPAYRDRKGYQSIIKPVFERLWKEGYSFKAIPTVEMSYQESLEIKKSFTIFIDQITWIGEYGNSAVEAMQYGVPVVAYISDESKKLSRCEEFCNAPVLNPGLDPEGLYQLLKDCLDGKVDLLSISKKTKSFCDSFHGYTNVARIWKEIYERVYESSCNL